MSKSSRYWVRLTLAFINRFKLIFIIGIGLGVVSFIFFNVFFPHLPKTKENIGVAGEYTPDRLPSFITSMIGIGLTQIDKTGHAVAGIAESYEASDSGKVWTFHLAKNLTWQDGSAVTTKDINYNFSDASLTKVDKYTLVFKLKTPLSNFPVVVSQAVFKQGLLGVGKWKVTGLTLAGSYAETLTLMDADNNEIIFRFYPTEDRVKLAFELGEIDRINDLADPKPFESWNTAKVDTKINNHRYAAVFFNTSDDLLTDKDIRQALSYGIDKGEWKNDRAYGPISPTSWGYNPSLKAYDFDITHAKELITGSKIDPNQKKNLKITLTTLPDLLPVANQIAKNWKEIGVTTTIQVTSFIPENYQAFLAIYDIPNDPDQYSTWHSTQTQTNITRYKNPRIDKLLEDGRLETDQNKRKAIYFDFQKYLVEDAPAAFLYYPTYYSVTKK